MKSPNMMVRKKKLVQDSNKSFNNWVSGCLNMPCCVQMFSTDRYKMTWDNFK